MEKMIVECVVVEVLFFVLWLLAIYYTNKYDEWDETPLGFIMDGIMRLVAKYCPKVMLAWIPISLGLIGLTGFFELLDQATKMFTI